MDLMDDFRKCLRELVAEYGMAPEEINNGYCADFATVIGDTWRVEILSDEDMGSNEYTHTFIRFRGRYYDAEAIDGVDDWKDLPIFKR
jgi:hypothetical protein